MTNKTDRTSFLFKAKDHRKYRQIVCSFPPWAPTVKISEKNMTSKMEKEKGKLGIKHVRA